MSEIEKLYPQFEPKLIKELKKLPVMEIEADMEVGMKGMNVDFIPLGVEGSIKVFEKDEKGREAVLYKIEPGVACIVSITSALTDEKAPTYAKSEMKSKVIMIPSEKSNKWFLKYSSWRNYVIELYNQRINDLIEKHEEVIEQKDEIEYKNRQIIESITYAKYIQKAVLPANEQMKEFFADYFILYKPKAIVSGDFYWTKKENDRIFFCAADATGHGVPGAFMSMLGISLMSEISFDFSGDAAGFLNILRGKIKQSLKQSEFNSSPRDGFDMQLCILYPKTGELDFAGANNHLLIARNKDLIEVKGDKMPVGVYFREKESFTNHRIKLQDNDVLYLFSDGYRDQFGGDKNHKFSMKLFKRVLSAISEFDLDEQKNILDEEFEKWKGDREQIDDVLVMGIKIKTE